MKQTVKVINLTADYITPLTYLKYSMPNKKMQYLL